MATFDHEKRGLGVSERTAECGQYRSSCYARFVQPPLPPFLLPLPATSPSFPRFIFHPTSPLPPPSPPPAAPLPLPPFLSLPRPRPLSGLPTPPPRGRRLPLAEAAPRLLHLLRLSWLLAVANLAVGRPAAAARLVAVAESAYGARRSAWREASAILATCIPGASAATAAAAPPLLARQQQQGLPRPSSLVLSPVAGGGVTTRVGRDGGGVGGGVGRGEGGGGGRGGEGGRGRARGGGGGRDPALATCRFLRGLAMLAGGDEAAAADRLEVMVY